MWFLKRIDTGSKFFILDKEKYIVSRVSGQGDLILTDDTSISRTHAYLYPSKDHIKIIDCGSKYGTFINENILGNIEMKRDLPIELRNGDKIRFGGLKNMWIVDQIPFNVLTSTLSIADKELLNNSLKIINGTVLETWSDDCTHITMSGIVVTLKLLQCMVAGLPIVTPQYWIKCIENLRANQDVPNHAEFIPSTIEKYINDVSFDINLNRKRIFTGKTFVFMVYKHMAKYETIIKLANGQSYSLDQRKMRLNLLTKPNIIVIQYIPSTQSQSYISITNLNESLRKKNLRVIPDCEIGLAILYCSIQKFCNPEHKLIENNYKNVCQFDTPTILADDTPLLINNVNNTSIDVPETAQSSTDINDKDTKIIEIIDDNISNTNEEPTQQFIITPENSEKNYGKRKASPMNSDDSTIIKRIHLQDSIGIAAVTSVVQPKASRKSSEFLTKRNIILNTTQINSKTKEPPIANTKNVTSKRFHNLLENDNPNDDDLFAFDDESLPKKKSKLLTTNKHTVGDANNGDDDLLFSFKSSSKNCSQTNRNVQPVSSSISDNVLQNVTSNSILQKKLLVKPIEINFDGWLSKTFKKDLTINNENESDSLLIPKKDEDEDESYYDEVDSTKKWIEDIKDKFEIKIKVLNLIARTSINSSTEYGQDNFGKNTNFKAFVKKFNYIRQTKIIDTFPVAI